MKSYRWIEPALVMLILGTIALAPSLPAQAPNAASTAKSGTEGVTTGCGEIIGDWPYSTIDDVGFFDHYALFSHGRALQVADVSDPASPEVVGEVVIPSRPWHLEVEGNLAFVAAGFAGLRIIDLSTPSAPVEVSHVDMGWAFSVGVSGSLVFVSDRELGLRVIDVSTPSMPTEVSTVEFDSLRTFVAASGDFVYLTMLAEPSFRVLDVSTPSTPVEVGSLSLGGSWGSEIGVSGQTVYAVSLDELFLIDVSSPASPSLLGTFEPVPQAAAVGRPRISDDVLYLTSFWNGLFVIDVSNPAAPSQITVFDAESASAVALIPGNQALLADGKGGLKILDTQTPAAPEELGSIEALGGLAVDTVSNGLAFGGGLPATGLSVFDVSDPTNPFPAGASGNVWDTQDVVIEGDIAVVAAGFAGLRIMDVSTPTAPVQIGFNNTHGYSYEVEVSGSTAYLADGERGMSVWDITDPTTPDRLDTSNPWGDVNDLVLAYPYVYASDADLGLRIFDVTTNEAIQVGDLPIEDAKQVARSGDLVFVTSPSGVHVVDVSLPAAPNQVGLFEEVEPSYEGQLEAYEGLVYLSTGGVNLDGDGSVVVLDVSDPSTPAQIASINEPIGGSILGASGHLFMSAGGLTILSPCHTLFSDGFESGDVSTWSAFVGGGT